MNFSSKDINNLGRATYKRRSRRISETIPAHHECQIFFYLMGFTGLCQRILRQVRSSSCLKYGPLIILWSTQKALPQLLVLPSSFSPPPPNFPLLHVTLELPWQTASDRSRVSLFLLPQCDLFGTSLLSLYPNFMCKCK